MQGNRKNSYQTYNEIFVRNDGIVVTVYRGDQSVTSIKRTINDLSLVTKKMRSMDKQVLILANVKDIGEVNLAARRLGISGLRNGDYDKVAIVGFFTIHASLANLFILASGMSFKVKFFYNEDEAVDWLFN